MIIKDNRIVCDITFALRLKNFIKSTEVNDAASADEKEYLLYVSKALLKHQIDTATDELELKYLENVKDLIYD